MHLIWCSGAEFGVYIEYSDSCADAMHAVFGVCVPGACGSHRHFAFVLLAALVKTTVVGAARICANGFAFARNSIRNL